MKTLHIEHKSKSNGGFTEMDTDLDFVGENMSDFPSWMDDWLPGIKADEPELELLPKLFSSEVVFLKTPEGRDYVWFHELKECGTALEAISQGSVWINSVNRIAKS